MFKNPALCVELELPSSQFFEGFEAASNAEKRKTLAICDNCAAQRECREKGRYEVWGVWGGQFKKNGRVMKIRKASYYEPKARVLNLGV